MIQALVGLVLTLIVVFRAIKNARSDSFSLCVLAFYIIQIVITGILSTENLGTTVRKSLCALAMIFVMRDIIIKKRYDALLNFAFLCEIYIFLNLILCAFLPDLFPLYTTDSRVYLMGIKNQMAGQLIPMAAILMIVNYGQRRKRNLLTFLALAAALLCEVIVNSSSGIVAAGVLLLCYILFDILPSRLLSLNKIIIGYIALNFLLVFSDLIIRLPGVSSFIINVLHKDITFSNRSVIWYKGILKALESPLFGIGRQHEGEIVFFEAVNIYDKSTAYSAHNVLIQTFAELGLAGLVPVGVLIVSTAKKARRMSEDPNKIVILGVMAVLVTFLTEAYELTYLFILLQFLYYAPYGALDSGKITQPRLYPTDPAILTKRKGQQN